MRHQGMGDAVLKQPIRVDARGKPRRLQHRNQTWSSRSAPFLTSEVNVMKATKTLLGLLSGLSIAIGCGDTTGTPVESATRVDPVLSTTPSGSGTQGYRVNGTRVEPASREGLSPAIAFGGPGVQAPVIQLCHGPGNVSLQPSQTMTLTCNVSSPLGGHQMLVFPQMWVPGNGCIVTADAPRVVMVGNNFGVSATLTNRCGTPYLASEGGLGWVIVRVA